MELLELLKYMFNKVGVAFTSLLAGTLTAFEDAMRVPLHDLGMPGPLQTVAIVLVPALSLVVILRWMRGVGVGTCFW